MLHPLTRISS
jgi:hypothetical protein